MASIYGNVIFTNTTSPSTIDTSGASATWVAPNQILVRGGVFRGGGFRGSGDRRILFNNPKIEKDDLPDDGI